MIMEIRRDKLDAFCARLREPRRFLQVVAGPRQGRKDTLGRQGRGELEQQTGNGGGRHARPAQSQ